MEEQNSSQDFYIVKVPPPLVKIQKEQLEKQYEFLNQERVRILRELDHKKADEYEIYRQLMWFCYLDKQIECRMSEIKNLERWNQDTVKPTLPVNNVPRTTGYICLTGKDAETPVRPGQKRCQNSVIKKSRLNIEYLQQFQEELLSLKKSSATQELKDMITSMSQRIQHGNMKRADEMKMYHEISKLEETKEILIARPEPQSRQWYTRELKTKRDIDWKRSLQHKINIRLDEIEILKRRQIGRTARVRRLKAESEHVRKSISYLTKKLESVNSKRLEAFNRAYQLGEQMKEMNSSDNDYESFKMHVKELAQKRDVVELEYVCNTQVEDFMRQWNDNKAFREDYEKRKVLWR